MSYKDWLETPFGNSSSLVPASCCKKSLNTTCVRTNLVDETHATDINQNVRIRNSVISHFQCSSCYLGLL